MIPKAIYMKKLIQFVDTCKDENTAEEIIKGIKNADFLNIVSLKIPLNSNSSKYGATKIITIKKNNNAITVERLICCNSFN